MSIIVEQPAAMMSIQDQGRKGYARFGLPESGPMDWWAHRAANCLVGNTPDAACLEIGLTGAIFMVDQDALLSVCGAGYQLRVNQRTIPLWTAFLVQKGDQVYLEKTPGGQWAYLAAAGGLQTQKWMGSRSVYPRAGLGRLTETGDILGVARWSSFQNRLAGSVLPDHLRPEYHDSPIIRAIPGPHTDRFVMDSLDFFWHSEFLLTSRSDRMGYRLNGSGLRHIHGADLVSQGMVLGEIQVPGDGQPIVMMPDHPTTGGYTCIATIIRCDLPMLAQASFGEARIRFLPDEPDQARDLYRSMVHRIDTGILLPDEEWQAW